MITIKVMRDTEHTVVFRDDYKKKRWQPADNRAHTLLLVILHGK